MICANWIKGPGAFISFSHLSSVLQSLNIFEKAVIHVVVTYNFVVENLKVFEEFEEAAMHSVVTSDPLVSPNSNPDIGAALNIVHCTLCTALHKTVHSILHCIVLYSCYHL